MYYDLGLHFDLWPVRFFCSEYIPLKHIIISILTFFSEYQWLRHRHFKTRLLNISKLRNLLLHKHQYDATYDKH